MPGIPRNAPRQPLYLPIVPKTTDADGAVSTAWAVVLAPVEHLAITHEPKVAAHDLLRTARERTEWTSTTTERIATVPLPVRVPRNSTAFCGHCRVNPTVTVCQPLAGGTRFASNRPMVFTDCDVDRRRRGRSVDHPYAERCRVVARRQPCIRPIPDPCPVRSTRADDRPAFETSILSSRTP